MIYAQQLTAFEKTVMEGLAHKAGLAAALLDAWTKLPSDSVQSARSLVTAAQLGGNRWHRAIPFVILL